MTVCLAAICVNEADGSPWAVLAADRMVTLGNLIEFEHAVPKMAHPSPQCIAAIAGQTLVGTRLAREVERQLADTNPSISQIAAALGSHYTTIRSSSMEHEILKPRGLDLATFYGNHAALNPQITALIDNQLSTYNLGVELLIAGADAEGAHLFTVANPGGPELQHDVIGYAAVGSGAIHALQAMIGFGHHPESGFTETLFRVYASKKRSEAAPGVGLDTDLLIISQEAKVKVQGDLLDQLDEAYESFNQATEDSLKAKLDALTEELQEASDADSGEEGEDPDPD